jgi:hypothetical protein
MRGAPLLRLLLVSAALLAALVPLRRLTTHPSPGPAPEVSGTTGASALVQIALQSTKKPFHFEIDHLGKPVWAGDAEGNEVETEIELPFPKEGVDLLVNASWADSGPAALKVEVTPEAGGVTTKVLWGNGSASDVFTIKPSSL